MHGVLTNYFPSAYYSSAIYIYPLLIPSFHETNQCPRQIAGIPKDKDTALHSPSHPSPYTPHPHPICKLPPSTITTITLASHIHTSLLSLSLIRQNAQTSPEKCQTRCVFYANEKKECLGICIGIPYEKECMDGYRIVCCKRA